MRVLSIPGGPCHFHPHVSTAFLRSVIPDGIVSPHPGSCIWTSAQTMPGPGRLCWGEYMDAHHPHTHPTHTCTHTHHTHVHTTHMYTVHMYTHHAHIHIMHEYTPHHVHSIHTMNTHVHTTHTPCAHHTHVHTTHIHTQCHTHHTQTAVGALSSTCPHSIPALSLCLQLLKPGLCFLVFSSHKDLPGRFSMTVC